MSVTVGLSLDFDAAHRLPDHVGKCRNLHGHRYTVEIEVGGEIKPDGMIVDFGKLKTAVGHMMDRFDHATLLREDDPLVPTLEGQKLLYFSKQPTVEIILAEIVNHLVLLLSNYPDHVFESKLTLVRVRLFETARCWAEWRP